MSYLDGKNVPGGMSPYTVWLRGGISPEIVSRETIKGGYIT